MDTQQQIEAKLNLIAASWGTVALKKVDKYSFEQLVEDLPAICKILQADVKRQVRKFVFVLLALYTKLVTETDLVLPDDQLESVYLMTWALMKPSKKGKKGSGRRENTIAIGLENTACLIGKYDWKSPDDETKTTTFSHPVFDCSKIGHRENINLAELKRQMSILKPRNNNKRKLAETESASEHSSSSAEEHPAKKLKVSESNTSNVSSVVSSSEPTSDSDSSSEYRDNEEPSSLANGELQCGSMYVSPRSSMEVESPSGASNYAPDMGHANHNYGDATANEQHVPIAGSDASVCATTDTYWPRELDSVSQPTAVLNEEQLLAWLVYHLTSGAKIDKLIGLLDQHKRIWYSDVVDQHAVGNLYNHPIAQELLKTEDARTQQWLGQFPVTNDGMVALQATPY